MAIVNSVATAGPGYGSGFLVSRTGVAVSSGAATAVPATGSLAQPVYRGKIRVKIYNGTGTSPTLTKLQIAITDGVNTVVVEDRNFGTAVTLNSTNYYDGVFNFLIDYSTAGGGATGTVLAPTVSTNAQVVNVTPTLGGTGPGATIDVEVYGEA